MDWNFEKREILYLILALVSMSLIAVAVNYQPLYDGISSLNPILQFIIINVGLYFVYFVLFKFLVGEDDAPSWEGALGNYLIFFSMDLLMPEYHVSVAHGLIAGGIFGMSSSDYFLGYLLHLLGASGWLLWILTYPVAFTILFVVGALMFKDFVGQL
jgi:hypothetical protein